MFLTSHLYSCEEGNALAKKCGATAFVGKEPTAILAALEPVTGRVPILSYEHAFTDDAIAIDLRDESVIVKKSRVSLPKLQLGALAYLLEKAPDTIGVGDLQDKVWKRTVARSAISKVIGQLIDRFPVWIERVDRGYRARVKTK